MRLNSKVTWGLAWAGLALVVAVPSADFLSGRIDGQKAAVLTSDTAPVQTATVTTTYKGITITPAIASTPADPVEKVLRNGKKLPSYITDGGSPSNTAVAKTTPQLPASTPPVVTTTASPATQVASLPTPAVAPVPFPSSVRAKALATPVAAIPVVAPATSADTPTAPVTPTATTVATLPAPTASSSVSTLPTVKSDGTTDAPLIIEDEPAPKRQAAIAPADGPVPPADVGGDESEDWNATELRTYLQKKGMIDNASGGSNQSSASVTTVKRPTRNFDSNGFYLNDGPNDERAARRARVRRLFEDQDDDSGFTLF